MNIEDIPDFFAVEKLAKALWKSGETRGAALFVGAGLSRAAKLPSPQTPTPPLWPNLRDEMCKRIYPGASGSSTCDPLRLAEEFRALLGQAALDDFIRDQVPDHAWQPGALHQRILRMPWADVLTTNWDLLLERAAASIADVGYEVVNSATDIARAKAPRIVKLHGSVPVGPFIFAEEDYRTYPVKNAPFVNLARQIFLENELCLVGFSGTDPNFLQWSGWVRDHLGASGRRIYLVGVLNLHAAARRLLESRNVAPIDLAPLVKDAEDGDKHSAALSAFIDYLERARPRPAYEWQLDHPTSAPTKHEDLERQRRDPEYAASLLDAAAARWEQDRIRYPGWLVCPPQYRYDLHFSLEAAPWPSNANLAPLSPQRRARLLYELVWRFEVGFWRMPARLTELLKPLAEPRAQSGLSRVEHLQLAICLLRDARERGDDAYFSELLKMLEVHGAGTPDIQAATAYEQCLQFRDRLDFAELAKCLSRLEGDDPVWPLRRAGLHCELGEYEEAQKLIIAALNDLRERQRRDRRSIWILSRRAWAQYLGHLASRGLWRTPEDRNENETWPLEYLEALADPKEQLRDIQNDVDEVHKNKDESFDAKPHFDAGTYTEPGRTVALRDSNATSPAYRLERIANITGAPFDIGAMDVMRSMARAAVTSEFDRTKASYYRLLGTLSSDRDDAIEEFFGRVEVAQIDTPVVEELVAALKNAISFWRARARRVYSVVGEIDFKQRSIDKLCVYVEILSRLAVRSSVPAARALFDQAFDLLRDESIKHFRLLRPIDHLLQRSSEPIPRMQHGDLVRAAIDMPLPSEYGMRAPDSYWPSPLTYLYYKSSRAPVEDPRWSNRIHELINAVRERSRETRSDAAARLFYLFEADLLQPQEQQQFGSALWARTDPQKGLPSDVNLLPHVFIFIPSPDPVAAETLFRSAVYEATGATLMSPSTLTALTGAAVLPRGKNVFPDHDQAVRVLHAALDWRAPEPSPFGFEIAQTRQTERLMGPALAKAIMPILSASDLSDETVAKLFLAIEERGIASAIAVLPWLAFRRPDQVTKVVRVIRRALVARNLDTLGGAVKAIAVWLDAEKVHEHFPSFPEGIVDQVVGAATSQRGANLGSLMTCARRLLVEKRLSSNHCVSLIEALGDLFHEIRYDQAGPPDRQPVAFSTLRAQCVRMAQALKDAGETDPSIALWLESAQNDPLPEVRWAISEPEE